MIRTVVKEYLDQIDQIHLLINKCLAESKARIREFDQNRESPRLRNAYQESVEATTLQTIES